MNAVTHHRRVGRAEDGAEARIEVGRNPWDDFQAELQPRLSAETKWRREEPLAAKTTMRVGGAARLYAEPASVADLQTLLRAAQARKIAVHLLGRGSNLIVPDEGVDGLV
ncbi:MAG: hypothetical protein WCP53_15290, partial [Verrucomicrobiota bacterium]